MSLRRCIVLALATLFTGTCCLAQDVSDAGLFLIRGHSATVRFTLGNKTRKAIPLRLAFARPQDTVSGLLLPPAKVSFESDPPGTALPAAISPGRSLPVVAVLSEIGQTSGASFALYNGAARIYDWRDAQAIDEPLNLVLADQGTSDKPLKLVRGQSANLLVKNNSADYLKMDWTFSIDGRGSRSGVGYLLPPNGTVAIPVDADWFSYSMDEFIRPGTHTASLALRLSNPISSSAIQLPRCELGVSVQLMGMAPEGLSVLSACYAGFVLLCGMLLSALGNIVVPCFLKAAEMRRHLRTLANRTSGVSTRVDSYLRVLLRLERKKIELLLQRAVAHPFSSSDALANAADVTDQLERRLQIAERTDDLCRRYEVARPTAPPSISDTIASSLQAASHQAHSLMLGTENIDAARALLDEAEKKIGVLKDFDAMKRVIAGRVADVLDRIEEHSKATRSGFDELKRGFPGYFANLNSDFKDPKNIHSALILELDYAVSGANALLDLAFVEEMLQKKILTGQTLQDDCDSELAKKRLERLKARKCQLFDLLRKPSWAAYAAAANLVRQIQEDVYEDDIVESIAQKCARIEFDTQRARPFAPVFFNIEFDQPRYAYSAALENLNTEWAFPDDLFEHGWKVCHYFSGSDRVGGLLGAAIDATAEKLRVLTGVPRSKPAKDIPIRFTASPPGGTRKPTLDRIIKVQQELPSENSGRWAGRIRLLIVFGVALGGIESGGIDKLTQLGFAEATVAILALGFGADAIKNLLVQTAKPGTAEAKATPSK